MKKILFIIIVLLLLIAAAVFSFMKEWQKCEVAINGNSVAVFDHKYQAKKLINNIIKEKQTDKDHQVNVSVSYNPTDKAPKSTDENTEILKKEIKVQVPCTVIIVDGEPLIGLPTKDDAGLFLLKVKEKYALPGCEEPEIKENITIDSSSIDADKYFKTPEEAIKYVFDTTIKVRQEAKVYTVKKGDTLSAIAKNNGTTVKKIKELNSDLSKLKIGQKINLSARITDRPKLTVVTRKEQHGIVVAEPPVIKVSSKKIPCGKQKVISKGVPGKKKVDGYVVFENGKKVREENTFEEFIVRPQPKQIAIGI